MTLLTKSSDSQKAVSFKKKIADRYNEVSRGMPLIYDGTLQMMLHASNSADRKKKGKTYG